MSDEAKKQQPRSAALGVGLSHGDLCEALMKPGRLGERVRFVRDLGRNGEFVLFDGERWLGQSHVDVLEAVRQFIRTQLIQRKITNPKAWEELTSVGHLNGVLAMWKTYPALHRPRKEWDLEGSVIHSPRSTWVLETGKRRDTLPTDYALKSLRFEPDGTMAMPLFLGVLDQMFTTPEDRAYFEYRIGATPWGHNDDRMFNWIIGETSSGKTTALTVIRRCLGTYARAVSSKMLILHRNSDVTKAGNQLAELEGYRMVQLEEIQETPGTRFDAWMIKTLASGNETQGERKYEQPGEITLGVSPWLTLNKLPPGALAGSDPASVEERLALMCADGTVPQAERDKTLASKIVRDEGPAVLAWLIEKARAYHEISTSPFGPGVVDMSDLAQKTVRSFVREGAAPVVGDWFAERVEVTGNDTDIIHTKTLWQDFVAWGAAKEGHGPYRHGLGEDTGPDGNFARGLARRLTGVTHKTQIKLNGERASGYFGVKLRETVNSNC